MRKIQSGQTAVYFILMIHTVISAAGSSMGFPQMAQSADTIAGDKIPSLEQVVTIHAEDAHLPSILAILAKESGFNIVTGPNVNKEDKISIHLDKVPIEQAVNLVVRAAGLSYEIVGNSFLVASQDKLEEEVGLTSHVIALKYANAAEVQALLEDLTDLIQVDQSGNKLLVITSPKKIAEIEEIVQEIDIPALQIMLEARLVEVSVADAEKLGIDWSRLSSLTTILAEDGSPPFGVSGAGSLVPGLTVSPTGSGVQEKFSPLTTGEIPEEMYFQRIRRGEFGYFSRQLYALDVTLDFLLKNNTAEVLANSQVVTLNGREATLSMVDVIPYVVSAGGVGGQVQVQREEVGIKLYILPTVNTDGYITTTVTPEVSTIFDFIGPDRNIPWVKKRLSTTTIRVQDGETILIAGLLGVDRKNTEDRVPFLWRLPWLGKKFFTHKDVTEKTTDLVIQITPHIIKDGYSGIRKSERMQKFEESVYPLEESDPKDDTAAPMKENKPRKQRKPASNPPGKKSSGVNESDGMTYTSKTGGGENSQSLSRSQQLDTETTSDQQPQPFQGGKEVP